MAQPNRPVGTNIPIGWNAAGLPQGQGLVPPVQENPVRYQPNMADPQFAGLPPSLAAAYSMQKQGPNPPSPAQTAGAQTTAATDPMTGLPNYFDPTWYVQNNPDVLAGFNSQKDKKEGMAWYGTQHLQNFSKGDGGQRFLGPNDPAYLARMQAGLAATPGTRPTDAQLAAYNQMKPEDQVNLINFLKGMGLA